MRKEVEAGAELYVETERKGERHQRLERRRSPCARDVGLTSIGELLLNGGILEITT